MCLQVFFGALSSRPPTFEPRAGLERCVETCTEKLALRRHLYGKQSVDRRIPIRSEEVAALEQRRAVYFVLLCARVSHASSRSTGGEASRPNVGIPTKALANPVVPHRGTTFYHERQSPSASEGGISPSAKLAMSAYGSGRRASECAPGPTGGDGRRGGPRPSGLRGSWPHLRPRLRPARPPARGDGDGAAAARAASGS